MKEIDKNTIEEQALLMYKETVSPSRKSLEMILSQIPEQKIQKRFSLLDEIQGKTRIFSEVYTPYSEEKIGSFDEVVRQESKSLKARAIRSPYILAEIIEFIMLFSIMFAVIPTLRDILNDPFYQIDKEVEIFEMGIQQQDYQDNLINYKL